MHCKYVNEEKSHNLHCWKGAAHELWTKQLTYAHISIHNIQHAVHKLTWLDTFVSLYLVTIISLYFFSAVLCLFPSLVFTLFYSIVCVGLKFTIFDCKNRKLVCSTNPTISAVHSCFCHFYNNVLRHYKEQS